MAIWNVVAACPKVLCQEGGDVVAQCGVEKPKVLLGSVLSGSSPSPIFHKFSLALSPLLPDNRTQDGKLSKFVLKGFFEWLMERTNHLPGRM